MSTAPRPSSVNLDRTAQRVARHGPRDAIFIADSIVAAALDVEVERLNAARRTKAAPPAPEPKSRAGGRSHDAR